MKNISNIDLNLLVVFGALCETRNTTKAAVQLGLSQPAVSHALSRLRDQFADPLFVRASKGLSPTSRALELERPVIELLRQLDAVVNKPMHFNPAKAQVTFRIATTDYFEVVVLPHVLKKIELEAPQVTIVSRPTLSALPKAEVEKGDYDLAIAGFYKDLPEGFFKQKLFDSDFVCVARNQHPRIKQKQLTIEKYAAEKHLLISMQGDMKARSKEILEKQGFVQNFAVGVSSFISPGWIIATTDLLLTCPRKLAQAFALYMPIQLHELPFDMPRIQVTQVWHERSHKDAAHIWLRQLIHQSCRELEL